MIETVDELNEYFWNQDSTFECKWATDQDGARCIECWYGPSLDDPETTEPVMVGRVYPTPNSEHGDLHAIQYARKLCDIDGYRLWMVVEDLAAHDLAQAQWYTQFFWTAISLSVGENAIREYLGVYADGDDLLIDPEFVYKSRADRISEHMEPSND